MSSYNNGGCTRDSGNGGITEQHNSGISKNNIALQEAVLQCITGF